MAIRLIVLTKIKEDYDVTLLQEPSINRGKIMGFGGVERIIYSTSSATPRICTVAKHGTEMPISHTMGQTHLLQKS